ncbi:lysis protein [Salmonella enterica]|nr:lysis protein [Salmonella enterica]EAX3606053.1 lysis protein [Salmonella enterica]EGW6279534.1 lysis protein [Salmonella enterica]EGX3932959.1 lysis protein [Salmonella enterica]
MSLHNTLSPAAYSTAISTVIYSLLDHFTHDEWYAIGIATGSICGVITMTANIYFKRQRNRILEQQKNGAKDES